MIKEVDVLLVEDNDSDAEMTIYALSRNRLANHLMRVRDGAEALDFLFAEGKYADRKLEILPKVILLDLKMPKVNGVEVLQRIKAEDRTKKIPVVILTSSKEDPDIKLCYALGSNSYVVKPVDFEAFHSAIAEVGLYWLIVNQPPI